MYVWKVCVIQATMSINMCFIQNDTEKNVIWTSLHPSQQRISPTVIINIFKMSCTYQSYLRLGGHNSSRRRNVELCQINICTLITNPEKCLKAASKMWFHTVVPGISKIPGSVAMIHFDRAAYVMDTCTFVSYKRDWRANIFLISWSGCSIKLIFISHC